MTVLQTSHAKGKRSTPTSYEAGERVSVLYEYTFDAAYTAATDKIELGLLPAGARVVGATVIGENLGSVTANVGLMTGAPGSTDNARTVGTDLFSAQSVNNTEANATALKCKTIAIDSSQHRAIGATISADVAAGSTKKLSLVLDYVF